MKLLRSLPIMVFALVLLSIVGFAVAVKSIPLLLVAGTLALISWYVTEGPRGRSLPRWVSSILVIAVSLNGIIDFVQHTGDVPGVLGRFTVWLTIIKLYERRTARDHLHLMSLSLLLMLVGCLVSQDLLFGVVLVAFSATGLYVLLLFQLYAANERAAARRRFATTPVGDTSPAYRPTAGRGLTTHFRLLSAVIGVVGLFFSIALFLIVPRTDVRGFIAPSFRAPLGPARTGFAEEVVLDGPSRITDSKRLVAELAVDTESVVPPVWRLRGAVLDRYERGIWRASAQTPEIVETRANTMLDLREPRGADVLSIVQRYRFHGGTDRLFTIDRVAEVETPAPARLAFERDHGTLRTADGVVVHAYTVVSRPPGAGAHSGRRAVGPAFAALGSQHPATSRLAEAAHAILAENGLPPRPGTPGVAGTWNARAAEAIAAHLRAGAYEYTLDRSGVVRRGEDPVVEFLFESRRGHCEFFASAHAALCRSVGIDARLVTGYVTTEYDAQARRYLIRESNAHAWVEVRTGPDRFLTVDPTPSGVLRPRVLAGRSWREQVAEWYQRLEGAWSSRVVRFDAHSQSRLVAAVDSQWLARGTNLLRDARRWMARVNRAFYFGPAGYIWLGLVGIAFIIACVAAFTWLRRRRRLRRQLQLQRVAAPEARRMARQLGFYLDLLVALERRGTPKPTWQPPLAFAGSLAHAHPDRADVVRRVGELYYEARYANRRLSPAELAEAKKLVASLAEAAS